MFPGITHTPSIGTLKYHLRFYDRDPDVLFTVPSSGTPENPYPCISHVSAIEAHIASWGGALFTLDWDLLDDLLNQMDGLESVILHTTLVEREDRLWLLTLGQYIVERLPFTRKRRGCSLQVYINKQHVPHVELRDPGEHPSLSQQQISRWPKQLVDWYLTRS